MKYCNNPDVLTHILLISVKSALFLMESLITYKRQRRETGQRKKTAVKTDDSTGAVGGHGWRVRARTFGWPSLSSLWKTWQNFQQSTALLDSGRRVTAAQKVWAPFSWCVPKMQGDGRSVKDQI